MTPPPPPPPPSPSPSPSPPEPPASPVAGPRDEDVRFDSGGIALAGTYADVPTPVAAALLITGSGQINRDSDARLIRTGVTRAAAEALAGVHVATLRYDKRGVGASGGDYLRAGMTQNLADARAALGWLASRAPGLPLLAVGLSEGTFYAAELAGSDPKVAGAVLLGAPARSGQQIIEYQLGMLATRLPAVVKAALRVTRRDFARSQGQRTERLKASTGDVIRMMGVRVNARWWRDFLGYDPTAALARITVPVLAITGGHDLQVPPEDVEAIGRLVHGPFEGHVVGDLSNTCSGPTLARSALAATAAPSVSR